MFKRARKLELFLVFLATARAGECRPDDDVANLSDLEGFDLGTLPVDMEA